MGYDLLRVAVPEVRHVEHGDPRADAVSPSDPFGEGTERVDGVSIQLCNGIL